MDMMVMENLFFGRSISRVYDLKGSVRARYNPDTTGSNKVLLDLNLLEALRTKPIFLGSKAKRRLERAIWNDTSFLAVCYFSGALLILLWVLSGKLLRFYFYIEYYYYDNFLFAVLSSQFCCQCIYCFCLFSQLMSWIIHCWLAWMRNARN